MSDYNTAHSPAIEALVAAELDEYSDGGYAKHSDARHSLEAFARAVLATERDSKAELVKALAGIVADLRALMKDAEGVI